MIPYNWLQQPLQAQTPQPVWGNHPPTTMPVGPQGQPENPMNGGSVFGRGMPGLQPVQRPPVPGMPQLQGSPFNPQIIHYAQQAMQQPQMASLSQFGPMAGGAQNRGMPNPMPTPIPGTHLPPGITQEDIIAAGQRMADDNSSSYNYFSNYPSWTSPEGNSFYNTGPGQYVDQGGFPRATAVNPADDPYGMSYGTSPGPVGTPSDSNVPGSIYWANLFGHQQL